MVRCSTRGQADSSTDDQLGVIRRCSQLEGRKEVDVIWLEGVSASNPDTIDATVNEIIERKLQFDDFDVVALQDPTRLTRCGADHGAAIRYQMDRHGILILYASRPANCPVAERHRGRAGEVQQERV